MVFAFKFQNLFQSAHEGIHGTNFAFAVGSGNIVTKCVDLGFKLSQAVLQQLFEALDGGAGTDACSFFCPPQFPAPRLGRDDKPEFGYPQSIGYALQILCGVFVVCACGLPKQIARRSLIRVAHFF